MRVQLANPADHAQVISWPLDVPLADWTLAGMHGVLGIHRHEVRLLETATRSYVIKELPDDPARRDWQVTRLLGEAGVPTVDTVALITDRPSGEGLLVTRYLDFSLPYRALLSGRGLQVPFLGERLIDALVGLIARLHLAGVYWGDCSLSNTLFLRDATALAAYAIDMETAESYPQLSDGQRRMDIEITTQNVAGDLFDLQAARRLPSDVDPFEVALSIESRYTRLWEELTAPAEFASNESYKIDQRIERLHELGFDVAELEVVTVDGGNRLRMIPKVVEAGYHARRLETLTGLEAEENQARRILSDFRQFHAGSPETAKLPKTLAAARWYEQQYLPTIGAVDPALAAHLEPAELYHQVLEHRWYLSERAGHDVGLTDAAQAYAREVLEPAVNNPPTAEMAVIVVDPDATGEMPVIVADPDATGEMPSIAVDPDTGPGAGADAGAAG